MVGQTRCHDRFDQRPRPARGLRRRGPARGVARLRDPGPADGDGRRTDLRARAGPAVHDTRGRGDVRRHRPRPTPLGRQGLRRPRAATGLRAASGRRPDGDLRAGGPDHRNAPVRGRRPLGAAGDRRAARADAPPLRRAAPHAAVACDVPPAARGRRSPGDRPADAAGLRRRGTRAGGALGRRRHPRPARQAAAPGRAGDQRARARGLPVEGAGARTRHSVALAVARAHTAKEEGREQPVAENYRIGDRGKRGLAPTSGCSSTSLTPTTSAARSATTRPR